MSLKYGERKLAFILLAGIFLALSVGIGSLISLRQAIHGKDEIVYDFSERLFDISRMHHLIDRKIASSRGYLISGKENFLIEAGSSRQKFLGLFESLEQRLTSQEGKNLLLRVRELEAEHQASLNLIYEKKAQNVSPVQINQEFEKEVVPRRDRLAQAMDQLLNYEIKYVDQKKEEALGRARNSERAILAMTIVACGFLIAMGFILFRIYERIAQAQETVKKSSEEEKRAGERFLDLVNHLDHSVVWEAEWDPLQFGFVSDRIQYLLGLPPKEVIDNPQMFFNYTHPEDVPVLRSLFERAISTGRDQRCEHRMSTIENKEIWVHTGVHVRKNPDGRDQLFGLTVDVTPLKNAQKEAQAIQERYHLALRAAQIGVFEVDLEARLIEWSVMGEQLFGVSKGRRMTIDEAMERIHPEDRDYARKSILESINGKGEYRAEFRILQADGAVRWLLGMGEVISDMRGSGTRILGINMDITHEKNIQLRLSKTIKDLDDFKAALDASSIVAITDKRGVITYVNDKFCEISKYSREELIGKTHQIINSGYHSKEFFQDLWSTIQSGMIWKGDIRNRAKDGSFYWVQTFIIPFFDEKGKPERFLAIRSDITERKEAEAALERSQAELRRAKEQAEAANLAKSTFLAHMSHEIRTPIGVVQGFAELLSESEQLNEDEREWVDIIRRNIRQLTGLIGEILDLSKVESEQLQIEKVRFRLSELIRDIKSTMLLRAEQKGIAFQVSADETLPEWIHSDPLRLRQILINLIGNAIKFTDRGFVRVHFFSEKDSPEKIRVNVTDTGIGMTDEQKERIFEPFVQAETSTSRLFGGTGLGLAISKKLAEALGGTLQVVKSEIGVGTTFQLGLCCLELSESKDESAGVEAKSKHLEKPLKGAEILVVEDSKDIQLLLERMLSEAGAKVQVANNGQEGVQQALGKDYDLVLMDIQMPEMDGHEAMVKLKSRGFQSPVVALTAHALSWEKEKALQEGFSAYLTKPISKEDLVETISNQMASQF